METESENTIKEEKLTSEQTTTKNEETLEFKEELQKTPVERLRDILIAEGKKAQEKGIKIEKGKFFSFSRSGLQIKECCLIGAAYLNLEDEEKSKEVLVGEKGKSRQDFIIHDLQKKLLNEFKYTEIVNFIEGFDNSEHNYSSPSPFLLLGQELYNQFSESKNG
jgi:hypothetical protein